MEAAEHHYHGLSLSPLFIAKLQVVSYSPTIQFASMYPTALLNLLSMSTSIMLRVMRNCEVHYRNPCDVRETIYSNATFNRASA